MLAHSSSNSSELAQSSFSFCAGVRSGEGATQGDEDWFSYQRAGSQSRITDVERFRATVPVVPSVVSQAGLSRYVYVQGRSGKRYVFSPIRADQAPLYDRALFACRYPGQSSVKVAMDFNAIAAPNQIYYVHILDHCHADNADQDAGLRDLLSDFCGSEIQ